MDTCPSCGGELTGPTLARAIPNDRAFGTAGVELRRCASCRRLAERATDHPAGWSDAGVDPSIDYMFDWEPQPIPPPWSVLPLEKRAELEAELKAEVAEGHSLFGMPIIAIASCEGCNEAVFSVETHPARFVSVHLTWSRTAEPAPRPLTKDLSFPLSRSLAEHAH